jgi:phosphate starvation-inducible PhoH-like protein
LAEKIIKLEDIDPREIYGMQNAKFDLMRSYFPKLKLIARGNEVKAIGEEDIIELFEQKLNLFVAHFHKYNRLTESNIERLITGDTESIMNGSDDIIVHGNHGKVVKAQTVNQRKMVESSMKNDMVFAVGPAGTGKTYTAVALAVRALKNKEVRRIILTRPAVEAGENLGFLPGDMKDKLDPYMQPLYDALGDLIPAEKLKALIEERVIQIAPLAFMRGRTLDKAFVILDEAQNTTEQQMKMFLTRMGRHARFIITGDMSQVDLPPKQRSGLHQAIRLLKGVKGVGFIRLDEKDVIRHELVKRIILAYEKNDRDKES